MATYITLLSYTGHGMRALEESPARADAFVKEVERAGATVRGLYWTTGDYDGVLVLDAPDEPTASRLLLKLRRQGNVKTKSMRAYDRAEFADLLSQTG